MERLETLTVGIEGQELDVGLDQEDWRGFDSGDHVAGAFHTAPCQGLAAYLGKLSHDCG